jgi:LCP family protein required for cell wall assembly
VVKDRDVETLLRSLADGDPISGRGPSGHGPDDLAAQALDRARIRHRRRSALVTVAAALSVITVAVGVDARVLHGDGLGHLRRASGPGPSAADGWPGARVNVLLLGGEAGTGGLGVRSDTILVVSIDTRTGDTLLVSVPRNLQRVPFPPGSRGAQLFPGGFYCLNATAGVNTECLLNAVWTWGQEHPQFYPGDPHPGRTATVQAVEQVTGLGINDVVMMDTRGLTSLVDAVGGVDVTITRRLPIGGDTEHRTATEWLAPGLHHLDGYHAMWFARSRWSTSDYDRMQRQRCLASALVRQVDAGKLAARLPEILRALERDFTTTIRMDDLPRWVDLAEKIRSARVRTLVLDDTVIDTVRPDVPGIRRLVAQVLDGGNAPVPDSPVTTGRSAPAGTVQDADVVCRG